MSHGGGYLPGWLHELLDLEWWGEWGISRALILWIVYLGLLFTLGHLIPNLPLFAFNWLAGTAPIWLPIALLSAFWDTWVTYGHSLYLSGRQVVLLEMRVPREVTKSPRAMEQALSALSMSSGEATPFDRAWALQVRPVFALEFASFGGDVHMYIWTWRPYKPIVEAAIYAQYPDVELVEVEDYASRFRFNPDTQMLWGVEWPLTSKMIKEDDFRINAYPLKSYIDFELEKDPKEEFKIDPLAQILEFMSSINPEEQLWAQIVFRKCGGKGGVLFPENWESKWIKMVKQEVNRVDLASRMNRTDDSVIESVDMVKKPEDLGFPSPSERQKYQVVTMERHLGKYPFEVGIRGLYITEKDIRGPIWAGFRWMWRPFGNPQYMTQLQPKRWHTNFDYPWQDFHDIRHVKQSRLALDAYRRRAFFYTPWVHPTNVMTNETLASLWHPPSRAVTAPGLVRIPATKSSPPANLPM